MENIDLDREVILEKKKVGDAIKAIYNTVKNVSTKSGKTIETLGTAAGKKAAKDVATRKAIVSTAKKYTEPAVKKATEIGKQGVKDIKTFVPPAAQVTGTVLKQTGEGIRQGAARSYEAGRQARQTYERIKQTKLAGRTQQALTSASERGKKDLKLTLDQGAKTWDQFSKDVKNKTSNLLGKAGQKTQTSNTAGKVGQKSQTAPVKKPDGRKKPMNPWLSFWKKDPNKNISNFKIQKPATTQKLLKGTPAAKQITGAATPKQLPGASTPKQLPGVKAKGSLPVGKVGGPITSTNTTARKQILDAGKPKAPTKATNTPSFNKDVKTAIAQGRKTKIGKIKRSNNVKLTTAFASGVLGGSVHTSWKSDKKGGESSVADASAIAASGGTGTTIGSAVGKAVGAVGKAPGKAGTVGAKVGAKVGGDGGKAAWLAKTANSPAAKSGVFSDDERWETHKKSKKK